MSQPTHKTAPQNHPISWSFPSSNSNGKEKDYESGFHYYGARYYWSELLTGWLSVDPMSDKYPNISPYNYCLWNPIRVVDPDGRDGEVVVNKNDMTISIAVRLYYNRNQLGIRNIVGTGEDPSQIDLALQKGFSSREWGYTDENNDVWKVSFDVSFIPQNSDGEVEKMLSSDPMGNKLCYDVNLGASGHWESASRTISLGTKSVIDVYLDDVGTLTHEIGHAWGLPDAKDVSEGVMGSNGAMSYNSCRRVNEKEVGYGVRRLLDVANTTEGRVVRLHVHNSAQTPQIVE